MTPYYEDESVRLYHADCKDVLPSLGLVDLLLTDPPYGIGEARGKNKSRSKPFGGKANGLSNEGGVVIATDYGVSAWDDTPPPSWLLDWARSLAKHQIVFGGNYFSLPPAKCWLVWDKDNGASDFADCELAWTNLDKAVRKLTYRWNGMLQEPGCPKESRVHPTQKPEAVMRWALSHVPDAQTVLDPFAGSGTTLVAAKRLGKHATGIERDERFCEAAAQRLSQGVLFAPEPQPDVVGGRSLWEETDTA
jgi:DNA modification methylase